MRIRSNFQICNSISLTNRTRKKRRGGRIDESYNFLSSNSWTIYHSLSNSFLLQYNKYIQMPTKVSIITFEEEKIREREYYLTKTSTITAEWQKITKEAERMLLASTLLKHICTQGSFSVYSNQPIRSSQKTPIF